MTEKKKYIVKNKHKYVGDPSKVISRSGWERQFFRMIDLDKRIIKWSSESISIFYKSPKDNKIHRYYPDVLLMTENKKIFLIEIKPYRETIPPKPSKLKRKSTLLKESITYNINMAKFEAARKYCKERGWEFKTISEKDVKFIR